MVLLAVSLLILGIWLGRCEIAAVPLLDCKCADLSDEPMIFDPCTSAGIFKSNTTLRKSMTTDTVLLPYDYYQCVNYGATFIRYTQRCSPQYIFYKTGDEQEKYLNAFDDSSKTCSTRLPSGATIYQCTLPTKCPTVVEECKVTR